VRIILSRKGFDSASGGCPSPIFPDGSMLAVPIPSEASPVTYHELRWRERELGPLVETLTNGRVRRTIGAHLDPDLRAEMRPRLPGWIASLGQHRSAQGHLKRRQIGAGDLFLFWGLFRRFDEQRGWSGSRMHIIWGWLQVGKVASVDETVRVGLSSKQWRWAADHPHLAFEPDASNTLYVAAERLKLSETAARGLPGAGVFEFYAPERQLTARGETKPSNWSLPLWFLPGRRTPLSFHPRPEQWTVSGDRVRLRATARGQEFVLDTLGYPEAIPWAAAIVGGTGTMAASSTVQR
jgi:hypothetical protein